MRFRRLGLSQLLEPRCTRVSGAIPDSLIRTSDLGGLTPHTKKLQGAFLSDLEPPSLYPRHPTPLRHIRWRRYSSGGFTASRARPHVVHDRANCAHAADDREVHAALTAPGDVRDGEVVFGGTRPQRGSTRRRRCGRSSSAAGSTATDVHRLRGRDAHLRASTSAPRRTSPRSWSSATASQKGDRVAIVMRNFPEWSIAFWAAAAAGAIVVPLNAWWTGRRAGVRARGLRRQGRCSSMPSGSSASPTCCPGSTSRRRRRRADGTARRGAERWEDVLGEVPADAELPDVDLEPEDLRDDLLHVGHDRPAEGRARHPPQHLRQPHLARVRRRAARRCAPGRPPRRDARPERVPAVGAVLPRHRDATRCWSPTCASGGKLVLMHKWDAERALELIERERVTTFGGVPAMVWQVLQSPSFETTRHLERAVDRLRRRARAARARAAHRGSCSPAARRRTATA